MCKKPTSAFFADDTRIMKEISCVNDTAMLQQDLNDVINWSLQNNMLLHEDKFDLITHRANPLSTLYELPHISKLFSYFTSSGITLYLTDTAKDLGVITSSDLSWSPHIGSIVSRVGSVASWHSFTQGPNPLNFLNSPLLANSLLNFENIPSSFFGK